MVMNAATFMLGGFALVIAMHFLYAYRHRSKTMSAATDRLTAAVTNLATAVDTATAKITALPNGNEPLINDTAAKVEDFTAKLNAAEPVAPVV